MVVGCCCVAVFGVLVCWLFFSLELPRVSTSKQRTNKNRVEEKESDIFESRIYFLSLEMQIMTSAT